MKILNEDYSVYLYFPRVDVELKDGMETYTDCELELPAEDVAECLQDYVYEDYPETENMSNDEYWKFLLDNIDELVDNKKYNKMLMDYYYADAVEQATEKAQEEYDNSEWDYTDSAYDEYKLRGMPGHESY